MPNLFQSNRVLQITSKLWSTYHDRVEECLDQTLTNLGTDYLDRMFFYPCAFLADYLSMTVYLIHWPARLIPDGDTFIPLRPDGSRNVDLNWKLSDTWKEMEAMVRKGWYKSSTRNSKLTIRHV